ncbi:MAG TPA: hypothetical protein VGZ47_21465 [Gemmataceae bacterium]|jgi:hypothetical protein|nr:hypothetical protein [Gemmataceae bacterium]
MPNFLSEPPAWLYGLLILLTVIPLLMALFITDKFVPKKSSEKKAVSRRTILFATGGIALALLLALGLCDYFFESDREQIVRKLKEMSHGVRDRNLNRVFDHISESFQVGSVDKARLRSVAESAIQSGEVTDIETWGEKLDPIPSGATEATVEFRFKVKPPPGGNEVGYLGKGYFVKERDGQWRLKKFEVFNPAVDTSQPIAIPHF